MEIKIKIDNRSKDGRTLLQYLQNLSYVEILEKDDEPYAREFVKEVVTRSESKNLVTIKNIDNIWESVL